MIGKVIWIYCLIMPFLHAIYLFVLFSYFYLSSLHDTYALLMFELELDQEDKDAAYVVHSVMYTYAVGA